MAMLPLLIQYLKISGGSEISSRWSCPCLDRSVSLPVASTCPWTKCPPSLWVGSRARSRLTVEPILREPSDVTLRVWCRRSKLAVSCDSSATVRQQPLVATDSPRASSEANGMAISYRAWSPRSVILVMVPVASTSPVNIFLGAGRFSEEGIGWSYSAGLFSVGSAVTSIFLAGGVFL